MNVREERRVIDALRAYTGGLTVTDQDINVAENRFRESVEPPAPRRRLVILAVAAAAVLVVGFFAVRAIGSDPDSAPPADKPSGPAEVLTAALQAHPYRLGIEQFTTGASPTLEDLAGFWMLRQPYGAPLIVEGDGDWLMGFPSGPAWFGTSAVNGDTWTRRHDDGTGCAQENGLAHFAHTWRAALAQDGSLRLRLTDGPNVCTPAEEREVWDRVAPGAPVADYLLAVTKDADWKAAPASYRWFGLYVAPATGHLLDVREDGTYQYYDALTGASIVPADRGELQFADGRTTVSCAGSPSTAGTEFARLPAVTGYLAAHDAVRFTSSGCATGPTTEQAWVRVFE
jgi:hypothetical protein